MQPTPRSRGSVLNGLLIVLCTVALALLARDWLARRDQTQPPPVLTRGDLAPGEKATIELFRLASPSVVSIKSSTIKQDFWTRRVMEVPRGVGTGFIWDQSGHIVTNHHVIAGANSAKVYLSDHSDLDAKLIGESPSKDLAVLKVSAPAEKLQPINLGTSADLQIGQQVLAIGNPFGLDQSLSSGIISALGREIQTENAFPIRDLIQTDAAINPGNSGGPLLDSAGLLIGVNTAIYSPSGAYAGLGFAIPVDTVNRVVPQLIRYGKAVLPDLGLELLRLRGQPGLVVSNVPRGSAAETAGLRNPRSDGLYWYMDSIVEVDGQAVDDAISLYRSLDRHKPGDVVTVKVLRGREALEVELPLEATEEEPTR